MKNVEMKLFVDANDDLGEIIAESNIDWQNVDSVSEAKDRIQYFEKINGEEMSGQDFIIHPYTLVSIGDKSGGLELLDWLAETDRKHYRVHLHGEDKLEKHILRERINALGLTEYADADLNKKIGDMMWYYSPDKPYLYYAGHRDYDIDLFHIFHYE